MPGDDFPRRAKISIMSYIHQTSRLNRLRVIAADDESELRDYYQRIIPHLGHDLLAIIDNTFDLLTSCQSMSPDLVIIDLEMPGNSDWAVQILAEHHDPPAIIAVTDQTEWSPSESDPGSAVRALVKPFFMDQLRDLIDELTRPAGWAPQQIAAE
jgi:CheY-like chemotaxis protein